MKKKHLNSAISLVLFALAFSFLHACNENDTNDLVNKPNTNNLTDSDRAALLFMLEEEKLARDTYIYLDNLWSINQFGNIKNSEQSHMDAIENLLLQNGIDYTILPVGKFANEALQNYYDEFIDEGTLSSTSALKIGATIEDLDIIDLQEYINATQNNSLIAVFENLKCGSTNHLRAFTRGLAMAGDSYEPQFLSQEEYNKIISDSNQKCGLAR